MWILYQHLVVNTTGASFWCMYEKNCINLHSLNVEYENGIWLSRHYHTLNMQHNNNISRSFTLTLRQSKGTPCVENFLVTADKLMMDIAQTIAHSSSWDLSSGLKDLIVEYLCPVFSHAHCCNNVTSQYSMSLSKSMRSANQNILPLPSSF